MFTGKHKQYRWVEWTDDSLWNLLEPFPQVIQGKYLVNTSFDSGSLTLSPEEIGLGWQAHQKTTLIPPLSNLDLLPYDQFDEWYIFSSATIINDCKVFVNYGGFSLHNQDYRTLQKEFWPHLEQIAPESYLAEGDNLIWVTNNDELYEQVLQASKSGG